jgi:hypothetical protein
MSIPKITLILGGVATMAGIGAYIMWGDNPSKDGGGEALLEDYQEFLEDLKNSKTKDKLSSSCENPEKFAKQIKDLEDRLADLQQRKSDLFDNIPQLPDIKDEDIIITESELRPGSEPLDLSDGDYSDVSPDKQLGSEPLELSDGDYSDINSGKVLGSEPLELSDGDYSDIPAEKQIGSEPLELSDGDYSDVSPDKQLGSEPLELSDGDYSDQRPGSQVLEMSEGDYFNDVPEIPEHDGGNILDQINEIEQQIIVEIKNLKSLCDEDEVISDSCPEACKKYSDCARYAEDETEEDIQDAYDSCMEECVNWSKEAVICINKKPIKKPLDCRDLSFCALPEYGGPGWKF